jgi:hypothetical protein
MEPMNSAGRFAVERRTRKTAGVIAVALGVLWMLAGSVACVEIDGGAVELAWLLRDFEGEPNDCQSARIAEIRVCWQPLGGDASLPEQNECVALATDGGRVEQFREFDCGARRGVTRFEIPGGSTSFFVEPLCQDGALPPGPYQVPPPIVRTVTNGSVVTLNQLLIVASNEQCAEENCTCPE